MATASIERLQLIADQMHTIAREEGDGKLMREFEDFASPLSWWDAWIDEGRPEEDTPPDYCPRPTLAMAKQHLADAGYRLGKGDKVVKK